MMVTSVIVITEKLYEALDEVRKSNHVHHSLDQVRVNMIGGKESREVTRTLRQAHKHET